MNKLFDFLRKQQKILFTALPMSSISRGKYPPLYIPRDATSVITLKFQNILYFVTGRAKDLSTGGLSTGVVRTAMST